jgi:hypothetical protein
MNKVDDHVAATSNKLSEISKQYHDIKRVRGFTVFVIHKYSTSCWWNLICSVEVSALVNQLD